MPSSRFVVAGATIASLVAASCRKPPPPPAPPAALRVTAIDLGRGLSPGNLISAPAQIFGPRDTIYASIATEGISQGGQVGVRFIYQTGGLVFQSSQPVARSGPSRAEFHIWRDTGWPVGFYRLEVFLDSVPAGSREYEVKKD
jgi:hypothetical protein